MGRGDRLLAAPPAEPATVRAGEIDYADPVALFAPFAADPHAALLESAGGLEPLSPKARSRGVAARRADEATARYSFVVPEPFAVITARDGLIAGDGPDRVGDPFEAVRAALARHPTRATPGLPPFQGGAVGYLGYELGSHLERVPVAPGDDLGLPDLALLLADVVVAVDHRDRRALVLSSGHPEPDPAARADRAEERLQGVRARLRDAPALGPPRAPRAAPAIEPNFTRPHYESAVRRVIDYVLAGDIFQANLAQRFAAELPEGLSALDLYRRLRAANPAPFASLLKLGDAAVVSSSPERFLRLRAGHVETRPIKGTRPRGATRAADAALADELLASEKDRAENVMIVDLLRNDLSRVCRDRSVAVPSLCALERFATVMHLVSTVTGELRPGLGAVDLLRACFPGGSITGAPKIRAMEIIAELEPTRRGPYCGAIGYLGFDGAMDTSVVIRTYALRGRRVTFHAGGGIVADSRPADEYEETLTKARALVAALSP